MATPQSRDLARSGLSPADPGSAVTRVGVEETGRTGGAGRRGRVPEDNRPGHHPDHEQDKPVDAFVAKAAALVAESQRGGGDAPGAGGEPGAGGDGDAVADAAPAAGAAPGGSAGGVPGHQRGWAAPGLGALRLEVAVPAIALIDAARQPTGAWDEIGESRAAWLGRISLLGWIGAWRYSTAVKPRLEAADRARRLAGA